jgi:hypothetical protein
MGESMEKGDARAVKRESTSANLANQQPDVQAMVSTET